MQSRCALLSMSVVALFGWASLVHAQSALKLEKLDHICLVGNTLGERMQHDGWLETLIQARFPQDQLTVRDLCEAADQVDLRLRVQGFGSPDDWLFQEKADVIFAFFGFNESFNGPAGVAQFKKQLDGYVKHVLGNTYNGHSAPRVVLFSSIAQEKIADPNLPDNSANNRNIRLYSDATAQVAAENKVAYVDLFTPSLSLYSKAPKPLTIDCIHLNDEGDRQIAKVIVDGLLGKSDDATDSTGIEKLRQAVLDKDFCFYYRYQTNDGYNVYGGRSYEKYNGVTNREVFQREMQVLDVMAANRDQRIWAVAQGKDLQVNDDNTPAFIDVPTNRPGPLPGGKYPYLGAQEAIKHMKLAPHLKVELVASEETYPDLANPVQMLFDTKGRLWVLAIPSYPHWRPKDDMNDKVLIFDLEDGKAVKETVFADHLNCPTGFALYDHGVYIATCPDLWYLKDTTGGDHANDRERVVEGLGIADTHHQANSFVFDPGGALYMQEGTFQATHVETLDGPVYCFNGGVYRFEPLTHKFESYVSYGFANPHGHVFDAWGQDFVTDGTGNVNYYAAGFSGHVDYPDKHKGYQPYFRQHYRPSPGTAIISSRHFPENMQGNLMDLNVIGFQGIGQYQIKEDGSGFKGIETTPLIQSDDLNFRPVAAAIGPDGAIYFLDWQNPLIGHLQHHLRDPNRDHTHGRIYRITCEGRPLLKPPQIAGAPIEQLLELLKAPEDSTRMLAKIELSGRDRTTVIAALPKYIESLDKNSTKYQHNLMEALWMYQWMNEVNEPLLKQMLRAPDYHARAAATRVLCYWRDRVKDPLASLKAQADDDSPRVRLEAVRACSFFQTSQAAEVALESLLKPQDGCLKYTLDETMRTLDKYNRK
ncbi:MAG TPA: PVC-type heme-binding CxxCH protein [Tepidisphaeraceae bacterium]|nr:PVC-type heme-binding CxxCH protein [Tepidisphaeraceae bacterium]